MGDMNGQVAWITGGGSGIGRALALELARRGAAVAVSGRRRAELDAVVSQIEADGGRALAVVCDVTVDAQVDAAVCTVVDTLGRLDIAVANAGYAAQGRVVDTSLGVWRRQLEVNVLGTVSTARHAIPELHRTGGRLVLVGSVAAFLGMAGQGPYAASKAAVASLGATLHTELAGTGVSCTTVHPGFVASDIAQVDSMGRHVGGRRDGRPKQLLWQPEHAARVIADAVARRERELVFTAHGKVAATLGRHVPGLVSALLTARARPVAPAPRPSELGILPLVPEAPVTLVADPSHASVLGRAALLARRRPQGVLADDARFAAVEVRLPGVVVGAPRVAAYRAVCGMPGPAEVLPLPLPEILFFGLLGTLATHARFPLSPLGLIHVGQTLTGHRPLLAGEPLDLAARLTQVTRTERGYELDVQLSAAAGGQVVWEAVTSLLSRAPGARGKSRTGPQIVPDGARIEVPADTGRAYARVSGDWNPHHLWAITARPLGYDRPIAHGMWSLARLIGLLPDSVDTSVGHAEVLFKRPILLPGAIIAGVVPTLDHRWRLDAWDPRRGSPHVTGWYRPGAASAP